MLWRMKVVPQLQGQERWGAGMERAEGAGLAGHRRVPERAASALACRVCRVGGPEPRKLHFI